MRYNRNVGKADKSSADSSPPYAMMTTAYLLNIQPERDLPKKPFFGSLAFHCTPLEQAFPCTGTDRSRTSTLFT